MTDAEIEGLLAERNADATAFKSGTVSLLGDVIANSIWTSLIGANYLAEGDSEQGQLLVNLCNSDNLSAIDGIERLVRQLTEDGLDAPAFPKWTAAYGEEYHRRSEEAYARRWAEGRIRVP